ncbi:YbaB/EbfC family nucleoid-associated protein [Mycobacterium parmense]|nr:YbaB/EbfC family nucleoid-associated protein [Mycobacterium parmense]MCV7352735.1 YbaB/EbfC family nucleoid-associated protein [Mycobacterium parmense]ORW54646.1 DNA-binding protein [Mycobacterium parmense]
MSAGTHPQVAQAMEHLQRFNSLLEGQMRRNDTGTFTGTDEAETVEVTLNGHRCVTGLEIEEGLLRLGAETVQERINEALLNAQAAATGAREAENAQLLRSLVEITGDLQKSVGLI